MGTGAAATPVRRHDDTTRSLARAIRVV